MAFPYEQETLANHALPQTSKKNDKKLETLKENIDQLCTGVLTPLCNADKAVELPSELEDSINIFIAYA